MAAKLTDHGSRVIAHFCARECDPSAIGAAKPGGGFGHRVQHRLATSCWQSANVLLCVAFIFGTSSGPASPADHTVIDAGYHRLTVATGRAAAGVSGTNDRIIPRPFGRSSTGSVTVLSNLHVRHLLRVHHYLSRVLCAEDERRNETMDIGGWLRGLGLERYEQAFRDNEIDWALLPKLTADDLKDLGSPSSATGVSCSKPSLRSAPRRLLPRYRLRQSRTHPPRRRRSGGS